MGEVAKKTFFFFVFGLSFLFFWDFECPICYVCPRVQFPDTFSTSGLLCFLRVSDLLRCARVRVPAWAPIARAQAVSSLLGEASEETFFLRCLVRVFLVFGFVAVGVRLSSVAGVALEP